MTRKQYVVEVVNQMTENPRAVLAGHGLSGAIVKMIAGRPDIMGKLATFAFSTTGAKKGAKGLKKAANFKISGYQNFAAFNTKARMDVEEFMNGLSASDAEKFTNENNIITFIVLPDTQTDNTEADIANLKSVAVPFASSVKKEYKIAGGIYITIMFGDSLILPRDAKIAETKAPLNKKIAARKTPAKIKAELTAKAKSKLARLKVANAKLAGKASKLGAEMEQFAEIGKAFGLEADASPRAVLNAMKTYNIQTKAFLKGLPKSDLKYFKIAMNAKADKKVKLMYHALNEVSPENYDKLYELVQGGNLTTAEKVLEARRKQMKLKIAEITNKNAELLAKAEAAPTAKLRANINFQIRKNLAMIEQLKAKMKSHSDLSLTKIKNKAKLLAQTNAAIDANRAAGMSIQEALNAAIAELPVDAVAKQQVKQQVVEQLATGTPLQYAVQQAVQRTPMQSTAEVTDFEDEFEAGLEGTEDVFGNLDDETADLASELATSKTIGDILANL